MTDLTSYQDAMHCKQACAEKLKEFIRQNLFSTVDKPTGQKL